MKILFLPFAKIELASSRLRAWWIAERLGADCHMWDGQIDLLMDYDVVVFQKQWDQARIEAYHKTSKAMRILKEAGKRVIWDLCDPIWWWIPKDAFQAHASHCSNIVVSSEGLADDLRPLGYNPFLSVKRSVIEDRLPFQQGTKEHKEVEIPTLVWFGHSTNRLPNLIGQTIVWKRLMEADNIPFKMRIIDDMPEMDQTFAFLSTNGRFEYRRFHYATEHKDILDCDVALLPPYPNPWGRMKGRVKWMTAAWAGLPIVDGNDYTLLADLLKNPISRQTFGESNRFIAERDYEIGKSIQEWKELLGC